MTPTVGPTTVPSADQVRVARLAAGLTLQQAAQLAGVAAHQRWAEYENGRRSIDAARWELFLLKAGLHPTLELCQRLSASDPLLEGRGRADKYPGDTGLADLLETRRRRPR